MGYDRINLQPTFKPIDNLFLDRLRQFIDDGHYRDFNLPKFYDKDRVDSNSDAIDIQVWKVPDKDGKTDRPLFKDIDFDEIEWKAARKGDSFGPSWKSFWFKIEWVIPEKWLALDQDIHFNWDCGNEGLIYDSKGMPLQAFTGGDRTVFRIPKKFRKGGKQLFYLEIACNSIFGNGSGGHPDPNRYFRLDRCDLILRDLEAHKLYFDFLIISDAARELGGGAQKYQAASLATTIMDTFDPNDRDSILECRKLAKKYLGDDFDSDAVFHKNPLNIIDVYSIGNCHIDTAWLWPFAETRRKIVRSWTTQLKITDEYPEYVFVASQMQQFKWLKEDHPEILAKIKEKFTTNQFLPIGGTWVENDTNLPGGESLIRQFLLGQRFLLDEFGAAATIFWLPDTFGYSSQIPQICQVVGIEKFLTQKLSWNNINRVPLSTFNWKAIDGSQVLVHMPPNDTYTAMANFGDVVRSQNQHKNLRDVPTGLLVYGYGDGGGGPTEDMLEKLRRCRGMANTVGAIPSVHVGNTVEEFYDDILERSDNGKSLPTWTGELYLEFHRGTYTTQADIKKWMRFSEVKMHDLELLATLLSVTTSYKYPTKEIHDLWENIALCQFHDVLPGSSIGMVYYEEAKPMLLHVMKTLDKLIDEALKEIDGKKEKAVAGVNTLPWHRIELLDVPTSEVEAMSLDSNVVRSVSGDVTSFGFNTETNNFVRKGDLKYPAKIEKVKDDTYVLSNDLLKAKITSSGIITSLVDLTTGREIIDTTVTKQSTGGGNQYVVFVDTPNGNDAWDTELYSFQKYKYLEGGEVISVTSNPLESKLVVKHDISSLSSILTTISLAGITTDSSITQNNYVKFSCHVDWHENAKFLKVQFPTTITTPPSALYETQFGITQRPTHWNTTWDVAKFEVAHHKFMDLSEYNYGVSVFNNCKYGASIHGNLLRLSLLRAPKAPDDQADMGTHDFEYALYPHSGTLGPNTVKLAHNFNYKLLQTVGSSKAVRSLVDSITLTGDNSLILSNVKRGEDDEDVNIYKNIPVQNKGQKSAVLRVYESLGGLSRGEIKFSGLKVDKVFRTNALEQIEEEIELLDDSVKISLRGFEIATFKVLFK
ncbi:CIC11C00000004730 [Sungouiella intermedia]|uniref:Alpha-mannosidase n=1 Tax=Sungouiella intermedia TaxID=45354 RepID=A0A1L0DLT6_9ASCO|nr:CIC11C00000004730 [[Candida] intermedia]